MKILFLKLIMHRPQSGSTIFVTVILEGLGTRTATFFFKVPGNDWNINAVIRKASLVWGLGRW